LQKDGGQRGELKVTARSFRAFAHHGAARRSGNGRAKIGEDLMIAVAALAPQPALIRSRP